MSIHIGAREDEIAETVLLSGDPLRAKLIAETLLEESFCYSDARNMLGFTGTYKGQNISVQGTGMGQASLAIYLHELIYSYGVKTAIRVGTCGAVQKRIGLGEVVIAQGACTDASFIKIIFGGMDYAPLPNFPLLKSAVELSEQQGISAHVGNVFSTDLFYQEGDPARWQVWADHGILCADMETSMLYTMAAKANVSALSILTVSDNIITGDFSTTDQREHGFTKMARLALSLVTGF